MVFTLFPLPLLISKSNEYAIKSLQQQGRIASLSVRGEGGDVPLTASRSVRSLRSARCWTLLSLTPSGRRSSLGQDSQHGGQECTEDVVLLAATAS